ncbi:MAG: GNAT family N-acetyltransferase [Myxococcota bacterium]|nr:GNAT family N-acetyltransferase [Myxococcota bacterium]
MHTCTPLEPAQVIDVRWRVLRAGRPRETAIFAGDDHALHHGLLHDGAIIGVVSLFDNPWEQGGADLRWQLRGMAILPEFQAHGHGSKLLTAVEDRVSQGLWCNARIRAVPFYARGGWQPVGEVFDIPAVGPHQRMFKTR